MSSASMIAGIITNLSAASVLGENNVSTDYIVLERATSACCAVINFQRIQWNPDTFGNPMGAGKQTHIFVEGYVRDNNNPEWMMENLSSFADSIVDSIASDNTLQDSIDTIREIEVTRRPNEAVSAGGFTWLPIYMEVVGFEFA